VVENQQYVDVLNSVINRPITGEQELGEAAGAVYDALFNLYRVSDFASVDVVLQSIDADATSPDLLLSFIMGTYLPHDEQVPSRREFIARCIEPLRQLGDDLASDVVKRYLNRE
jgi:hypothetical protein